ncbi:MAG: metal-dependent transcriptional regulator [Chloroflexi bacterium]|nr:metal-dependent transcriptional regulator [Chloroflexota bacterium]
MTQDEHLSEAIQDYLKAIYELSPMGGGSTSTNQLADRLSVAPASVTGMLKRLATMDPPLIDYQKHRGVQLTDAGKQVSLRIIRKHRLIELFLVQTLGYSWDEVHEEAERLEHAVSFRFSERLARFLGEPDFDPHGDPIPNRDLHLPAMQTIPLSEAREGQQVKVRRVLSSDPALLRYLGKLGIRPGARLSVLSRVPFDRTIHITVEDDETERVLGSEISVLLQVETL